MDFGWIIVWMFLDLWILCWFSGGNPFSTLIGASPVAQAIMRVSRTARASRRRASGRRASELSINSDESGKSNMTLRPGWRGWRGDGWRWGGFFGWKVSVLLGWRWARRTWRLLGGKNICWRLDSPGMFHWGLGVEGRQGGQGVFSHKSGYNLICLHMT